MAATAFARQISDFVDALNIDEGGVHVHREDFEIGPNDVAFRRQATSICCAWACSISSRFCATVNRVWRTTHARSFGRSAAREMSRAHVRWHH